MMKPCQTSLNKHAAKLGKRKEGRERVDPNLSQKSKTIKSGSLWGIGTIPAPEPPIILIDH
jgi:hypothetical protein